MKHYCAHCGIETNHIIHVLSKYSYLCGKTVCKVCCEQFVKPEIRNYKGYLCKMQKRINTIRATVNLDKAKSTDTVNLIVS